MTKAMIRCRKFALWKARPASTRAATLAAAPLRVAILAAVIPAAVATPVEEVATPVEVVGIPVEVATPVAVGTPVALDTKLAVIRALIPAIPEAAIALGYPGAQVMTWKITLNYCR
jgi:hypothetical protein